LVLRANGLARRFGERAAVDGVGFEIRLGETYGLLVPTAPTGQAALSARIAVSGIVNATEAPIVAAQLAAHPREYEQRVVGFFDRALLATP
jgi:ABC-type branched-subunit amino acid transport system ATPase component